VKAITPVFTNIGNNLANVAKGWDNKILNVTFPKIELEGLKLNTELKKIGATKITSPAMTKLIETTLGNFKTILTTDIDTPLKTAKLNLASSITNALAGKQFQGIQIAHDMGNIIKNNSFEGLDRAGQDIKLTIKSAALENMGANVAQLTGITNQNDRVVLSSMLNLKWENPMNKIMKIDENLMNPLNLRFDASAIATKDLMKTMVIDKGFKVETFMPTVAQTITPASRMVYDTTKIDPGMKAWLTDKKFIGTTERDTGELVSEKKVDGKTVVQAMLEYKMENPKVTAKIPTPMLKEGVIGTQAITKPAPAPTKPTPVRMLTFDADIQMKGSTPVTPVALPAQTPTGQFRVELTDPYSKQQAFKYVTREDAQKAFNILHAQQPESRIRLSEIVTGVDADGDPYTSEYGIKAIGGTETPLRTPTYTSKTIEGLGTIKFEDNIAQLTPTQQKMMAPQGRDTTTPQNINILPQNIQDIINPMLAGKTAKQVSTEQYINEAKKVAPQQLQRETTWTGKIKEGTFANEYSSTVVKPITNEDMRTSLLPKDSFINQALAWYQNNVYDMDKDINLRNGLLQQDEVTTTIGIQKKTGIEIPTGQTAQTQVVTMPVLRLTDAGVATVNKIVKDKKNGIVTPTTMDYLVYTTDEGIKNIPTFNKQILARDLNGHWGGVVANTIGENGIANVLTDPTVRANMATIYDGQTWEKIVGGSKEILNTKITGNPLVDGLIAIGSGGILGFETDAARLIIKEFAALGKVAKSAKFADLVAKELASVNIKLPVNVNFGEISIGESVAAALLRKTPISAGAIIQPKTIINLGTTNQNIATEAMAIVAKESKNEPKLIAIKLDAIVGTGKIPVTRAEVKTIALAADPVIRPKIVQELENIWIKPAKTTSEILPVIKTADPIDVEKFKNTIRIGDTAQTTIKVPQADAADLQKYVNTNKIYTLPGAGTVKIETVGKDTITIRPATMIEQTDASKKFTIDYVNQKSLGPEIKTTINEEIATLENTKRQLPTSATNVNTIKAIDTQIKDLKAIIKQDELITPTKIDQNIDIVEAEVKAVTKPATSVPLPSAVAQRATASRLEKVTLESTDMATLQRVNPESANAVKRMMDNADNPTVVKAITESQAWKNVPAPVKAWTNTAVAAKVEERVIADAMTSVKKLDYQTAASKLKNVEVTRARAATPDIPIRQLDELKAHGVPQNVIDGMKDARRADAMRQLEQKGLRGALTNLETGKMLSPADTKKLFADRALVEDALGLTDDVARKTRIYDEYANMLMKQSDEVALHGTDAERAALKAERDAFRKNIEDEMTKCADETPLTGGCAGFASGGGGSGAKIAAVGVGALAAGALLASTQTAEGKKYLYDKGDDTWMEIVPVGPKTVPVVGEKRRTEEGYEFININILPAYDKLMESNIPGQAYVEGDLESLTTNQNNCQDFAIKGANLINSDSTLNNKGLQAKIVTVIATITKAPTGAALQPGDPLGHALIKVENTNKQIGSYVDPKTGKTTPIYESTLVEPQTGQTGETGTDITGTSMKLGKYEYTIEAMQEMKTGEQQLIMQYDLGKKLVTTVPTSTTITTIFEGPTPGLNTSISKAAALGANESVLATGRVDPFWTTGAKPKVLPTMNLGA